MTAAVPSPGPRCDAAIVFAVALEADAFAARATDTAEFQSGGLVLHEGLVAGRRVAWCVAGVGCERAGRAARLLALGHRPRMLISAGFAGGLDPSLARGAVVRPTRVITAQSGEPLALAADGAQPPMSIVTVDEIVVSAAGKRALRDATGAAVVDMETHAVAAAARDEGLSCSSIRVISDDAGSDLPREVAALARPQSPLRRLGAALGSIGRRPAAALDLWTLYEHAVVDGKTLAAGLVELLTSLSAADRRPS
jgi:adenosylhomocysteine nucleosidase